MYSFWCCCKWNCFLIFIFELFPASVQTLIWVLHFDPLSCSFAGFVCWCYQFFLSGSLRICCIQGHVTCKEWQFTSSFPIWKSLISFSCLISPARISVKCWIEVVRMVIFVISLILGRKHFVSIRYDVSWRVSSWFCFCFILFFLVFVFVLFCFFLGHAFYCVEGFPPTSSLWSVFSTRG